MSADTTTSTSTAPAGAVLEQIDPASLLRTLQEAVARILRDDRADTSSVQPLFNAA